MFKEELLLVPKKPGSYQMYNKDNIIIYVGKAKNLFNRLHSYFTGKVTGKTKKMVSEVAYFKYIVTDSEKEAFILEINLIKKYDPKYNILLKDDKSYPYIELTNEKYKRLIVKREINIKKNNSHLYGPYPNSYAAKRMVNLINRLYPLRKCINIPKKECLYYHIHECNGYCINKNIDDKEMINEIVSILSGNNKILIDKINEKIKINSDNMNYEVCKELKEDLEYLKITNKKQSVELNDNINRDIINYYYDNSYISICILFIRGGKLLGMHNKIVPLIEEIKDTLETYITEFYSKNNIPAKEIIVPAEADIDILSSFIDSKFIKVFKGSKHRIFMLASSNAKIYYDNEIKRINENENITENANNELRMILGLDSLHTIEAFDNSNLFGTFSVSAMVCFIDGVASKNNYRKFKLSFDKNDDVMSMKEVIYRRYFRALNEDLPLPDLIIVDGAINQINACVSTLKSLNLNIKVIGIKKDNHHSPSAIIDENNNEITIDKNSYVFRLLSKIDEEAHRFVINYHKDIRSKSSLSSVLDYIDGIGNIRKKELIKKYGNINNIKNESIENLSKILPINVAKNLHEFLNNNTLN